MAQTKTTKDRQPAIDNYNRASRVKQRIIWLYYRGAQTNNSEGLSPTGIVGGVTDYSISGNVKYHLNSKQFRHQAKNLCEIALELSSDNIYIEEPILLPPPGKATPNNEASATTSEAFEIEVEGTDEEDNYKKSEDHKCNSDDESEGTAYSEEKQVSFATMSTKKASIASPGSAMKKKAPPRKLPAITGSVGAPIANGIAAPIVKGCFLVRDPKTRKRFNHYHIRMLWHNFVTTGDIFYEWIDDRTLKVVVYDPNWWSDPEYQAAFDSEHGKDSNLIDSMIDFQEDRKEQVPGQDKKRTGNSGYFVFGEAMSIKEEDDTVVIPQAILHNTINGVYIVIKVRVAHDDLAAEESTPRKAKAGGAAVTVGIG